MFRQGWERLNFRHFFDSVDLYGAFVGVRASESTGWHHVAGVFDGKSSRRVYLDGKLVDEGGQDRTVTKAEATGASFQYVALWNKALTAEEVTQLYQGASPLNVAPHNLREYYPDTDPSIRMTYDSGSFDGPMEPELPEDVTLAGWVGGEDGRQS